MKFIKGNSLFFMLFLGVALAIIVLPPILKKKANQYRDSIIAKIEEENRREKDADLIKAIEETRDRLELEIAELHGELRSNRITLNKLRNDNKKIQAQRDSISNSIDSLSSDELASKLSDRFRHPVRVELRAR